MRLEIDDLTAEVSTLKDEQAKSRELQRLHNEHLAKVEEREKELQLHLHEAISTLRGTLHVAHHLFHGWLALPKLIVCLSRFSCRRSGRSK
jgi:hypothetical protein